MPTVRPPTVHDRAVALVALAEARTVILDTAKGERRLAAAIHGLGHPDIPQAIGLALLHSLETALVRQRAAERNLAGYTIAGRAAPQAARDRVSLAIVATRLAAWALLHPPYARPCAGHAGAGLPVEAIVEADPDDRRRLCKGCGEDPDVVVVTMSERKTPVVSFALSVPSFPGGSR